MEGVVDFNMRQILARIGGIDICTTEFIRVTNHLLPTRVFTKYCPELETIHDSLDSTNSINLPTRIQLLGSDAKALAENAKKAAALGAIGIDLNFGCPAKTVNKSNGGACLLDKTSLLQEIVSQVRSAVPDTTPVTAKIRLGYNDRSSYLRNAKAIEEAGANELVVHARSKQDGYKPPAYWPLIGEISDALEIPVVANGEIWSVDHYHQCREESRCESVMLGRGLLANPFLACQIRGKHQKNSLHSERWNHVAALVHHYFLDTSEHYPSKYLGNRVKQWLHYLKLHFPEATKLFEDIKREREFERLNSRLRAAYS